MKYKHFIVALATTAILTACGGNDTGEEMTFESVKVEKTVSITNESGAPQCKVSLQLLPSRVVLPNGQRLSTRC